MLLFCPQRGSANPTKRGRKAFRRFLNQLNLHVRLQLNNVSWVRTAAVIDCVWLFRRVCLGCKINPIPTQRDAERHTHSSETCYSVGWALASQTELYLLMGPVSDPADWWCSVGCLFWFLVPLWHDPLLPQVSDKTLPGQTPVNGNKVSSMGNKQIKLISYQTEAKRGNRTLTSCRRPQTEGKENVTFGHVSMSGFIFLKWH